MDENQLSRIILQACITVHSALGPGLLESAYEECLYYELHEKWNLDVKRQMPIKLVYDGKEIGDGFRADLVVENKVLIELKSVKSLSEINFAQTLTYLKLTGLKLGLLVNFNTLKVSKDFHRIVNGL